MKKVDRKYILTDSCSWYEDDNYPNPNKKRNPHFATIVDLENGTVVELPSGSIIKIVKIKK